MKDDETCIAGDPLSRARSGDALAFTMLVRQHQRRVYSLALRMLWDRHEAEDLAQEVFVQLHRKLHLIQSEKHLALWLRKVTTHLAIDRLRRDHKFDALPLEDAAAIADESADRDPLLQQQLGKLIAQLPPVPRAIVLLRYQEDLDPTEIAKTLDLSLHTVKSHLKRSLATFREKLPEASVTAIETPSMREDSSSDTIDLGHDQRS